MTSLDRAFGRLRQFARYAVGRIVGTTEHTNGAYKQLLSLDEARHLHRVEITALARLMIDKGVFTSEEFAHQTLEEAIALEHQLKEVFPEVTPADDGGSLRIDAAGFAKRCKDEQWPK